MHPLCSALFSSTQPFTLLDETRVNALDGPSLMPTTFEKRQKEKNRQDRQRDKEAKRDQRKVEKANRPAGVAGEDPDIAGIVPGPQPVNDDY